MVLQARVLLSSMGISISSFMMLARRTGTSRFRNTKLKVRMGIAKLKDFSRQMTEEIYVEN
jgi:hypothetical protein